jgi:preprotein translocase subunit YajC
MIAQVLLAQATAPTTSGATGREPGPLLQFLTSGMMPILLGIIVLYFFMFRSKSNERKQRESMLSRLKRGDRVQTIGGILGTVIEARDHDVLLKVDESSNTKIRFARSAIHRVVEEEKVEAK